MDKTLLNYNSRLRPMKRKGQCGDPEYVESDETLRDKVNSLMKLIRGSEYCVVMTGAGVSTAAGIADFRGPKGVWTREARGETIGEEEKTCDSFNCAKPTFTHYALVTLMQLGFLKHIISQNVDGLHLRSGIPIENISEIHGNIFMEICEKCKRRYLRDHDVGGMGLKYTGNKCEAAGCNGRLKDFAIDWDTNLPEDIMKQAKTEIQKCDLLICIGTSLRIHPAGNMPEAVFKPHKLRKNKTGKLVVVNLQETHLDESATLNIHHYCDTVMRMLCKKLRVHVDEVDGARNCPDFHNPDYFQLSPTQNSGCSSEMTSNGSSFDKTTRSTSNSRLIGNDSDTKYDNENLPIKKRRKISIERADREVEEIVDLSDL